MHMYILHDKNVIKIKCLSSQKGQEINITEYAEMTEQTQIGASAGKQTSTNTLECHQRQRRNIMWSDAQRSV